MDLAPPNKRARTPNFSSFEIDLLIELSGRHKAVIENKRTDGVSVRDKEAAWKQIEAEFNCSPGVTRRTADKLKTCYENLKRKAKQDSADEKLQLKKTGGGYYNPKTNSATQRILAILGPAATPLNNPFDSDAVDISGADTDHCTVLLLDDESEKEKTDKKLPEEVEPTTLAADPVTPEQSTIATPRRWQHRRLPKMPTSKPGVAMEEACRKRATVLDEELIMRKLEHDKTMALKEQEQEINVIKLEILKEKLKYWKNMNSK